MRGFSSSRSTRVAAVLIAGAALVATASAADRVVLMEYFNSTT
jgi:hypothetical protein